MRSLVLFIVCVCSPFAFAKGRTTEGQINFYSAALEKLPSIVICSNFRSTEASSHSQSASNDLNHIFEALQNRHKAQLTMKELQATRSGSDNVGELCAIVVKQ